MKAITKLFYLGFLVIAFSACKSDDDNATPNSGGGTANATTDATIVTELKNSNFTYYQNDATTMLMAKGNSPHGSFRLKFNDVAQAALDPMTGKLPQGAIFADGSLIVKETFNGSGAPGLVAVMKKEPDNPNAAGGWVWNEVGPDGTSIVYSVNLKGAGCLGCHSGNTNRDLVTSFDLH